MSGGDPIPLKISYAQASGLASAAAAAAGSAPVVNLADAISIQRSQY